MRIVKKIVLITTTQPAVNPRIVKEADTLSAQGYYVTILYCFVTAWAQEKDKSILKDAIWNYKQIGGKKKSSYSYRRSRFFFAFYKFINKKSGGAYFAEEAHARCYSSLLLEAIKLKADWYIGHNPGAMAVAANAATCTGAKAGFDFEDYHRGEYTDVNDPGAKRQVYLENKYAAKFSYISAASPLITEKIKHSLPFRHSNLISVLNVFPLGDQPVLRPKKESNKELKLFWFSQHIGRDRGLEIVIEVMKDLHMENIKLTLVGCVSDKIKQYFREVAGPAAANISFAGIISPDKLSLYASEFDIGLALELPVPLNRDICLTNKVFTYLLAGNAIIYSETSMQKEFNDKYKTGLSFPVGDKDAVKECLLFFLDKDKLFEQRKYNYLLAQETFNWDVESKKLLEVIN